MDHHIETPFNCNAVPLACLEVENSGLAAKRRGSEAYGAEAGLPLDRVRKGTALCQIVYQHDAVPRLTGTEVIQSIIRA